jgi:hypothetical protein
LLLLEKGAKPAIPALKKALDDQDEIPPLAAWALYKAGERKLSEKWMLETITNNPGNKMLANVLDWMGEKSHPILAKIPGGKLPKKGLLKDVVKRAEARKRG